MLLKSVRFMEQSFCHWVSAVLAVRKQEHNTPLHKISDFNASLLSVLEQHYFAAFLCSFSQTLCVLDTESQCLSSLIGVAWVHTLQMLRSWFTVSSFAPSFSRALGEQLPRLHVPSIISQSSTAWRLCSLKQNVLHAKLQVHLPSTALIGFVGSLGICLMCAQDTYIKLWCTQFLQIIKPDVSLINL